MSIEVLYFAALAETVGCSCETVVLPPGATNVEELWAILGERHPGLRGLRYRPLVACDRVYSGWDRRLDGVREVAFLPPVSGG